MRIEMKVSLFAMILAAFAVMTNAAPITYEFGSAGATGAALDGLGTGTHTVGGVEIDATANPTGVFNQTGTSFGINAAAGGDDTDEFDDTSSDGAESMAFSFDVGGMLTSIEVEVWGGTDEATVAFDGGPVFAFDASTDPDIFSIGTSFTAGQTVTLAFTNGTGFGLVNIVIDASAVPAPAALPAGLALIGVAAARRNRR